MDWQRGSDADWRRGPEANRRLESLKKWVGWWVGDVELRWFGGRCQRGSSRVSVDEIER